MSLNEEVIMLQIIKSEFRYNKYSFLTLYFLVIALPVMVGVIESRKADVMIPAVLFVMGVAVFIVMVSGYLIRFSSKRDRLHYLLPLSTRRIALARYLIAILFWLSLVVLFLFSLIFVKPETFIMKHRGFESTLLWDLIALNGFLLILNANYLLSRDLAFCFRRKRKILFVYYDQIPSILSNLTTFFIIVFISYMDVFNVEPGRAIIFSTLVSPFGAVSLNCVGLLISLVSIRIYSNRTSYLN